MMEQMIKVNGCDYYCSISGEGEQTLVFLHGLLWNYQMFRSQIQEFESSYRCIAIDLRGHGRSEKVLEGYELEAQTEDIRVILEHLGASSYGVIGLSMGGFIGIRLAAAEGTKVSRLVLISTSSEPEPVFTQIKYKALATMVRVFGMKSVKRAVFPILFAKSFLKEGARQADRKEWENHFCSNDGRSVSKAVEGIMKRKGYTDQLHRITCPTHIIVGGEDTATPLMYSKLIKQEIAGSSLEVIPSAGHSVTIEAPERVNRSLGKFLNDTNSAGK